MAPPLPPFAAAAIPASALQASSRHCVHAPRAAPDPAGSCCISCPLPCSSPPHRSPSPDYVDDADDADGAAALGPPIFVEAEPYDVLPPDTLRLVKLPNILAADPLPFDAQRFLQVGRRWAQRASERARTHARPQPNCVCGRGAALPRASGERRGSRACG